MPKYDLTKVLPHKPPMIFLDDILEYNLEEQILWAMFTVSHEKILFDNKINGINSLAGLEFMAQTIGCYSHFKSGEKEPTPGLLLGSRLFNNSIDKFESGETYKVCVKESFSDNEIYAFDCQIFDNQNKELQSACIKVFKSVNIKELLKNG